MPDYADLRTFAEELADAARRVCLPYFRTAPEVITKADDSPVTRADRETEQRLRELITARDPAAGVIGEEGGAERPDAEFVWVIDPVDGTKSFITGFPTFGTLIAVLHRGRPVVGVIDMPALDERWVGAAGEDTAYQCGTVRGRARTRSCSDIASAVVSTTSIDMFEGATLEAFDALSRQARLRRFGGDCYQYGRLASGDLDLVIEAKLAPYDHLALVPVIEGAGGKVTGWAGETLGLESDGRILAAGSPELHAAALAVLGGRG